MNKLTVLHVNAKTLADTDYRVGFARSSRTCDVILGAPVQGDSSELHLADLGLGRDGREVGFAVMARLLVYLWRHRRRLDCVHFYSTKLVVAGPLLAAVARVPSVMTITGLGRSFFGSGPLTAVQQFLYRRAVALSLRLVEACFFENHGQLRRFARWYPRRTEKLRYVGSGVGTPPRPAAPPPPARPELTVLHAARLLPDKGIDDFLAVARELAPEGFRFVLAGPAAPGHRSVAGRVEKADREGVIDYLGVVPHRELWRHYASADVLFFPSTSNEGIPRVLLEAGMAGLCPVCYPIDATADLISPGRGFLVPAEDREAVAALLRRLRDDPGLREANASAYREFVTEEYGIEAYTARLDAHMDELFGDRARERS